MTSFEASIAHAIRQLSLAAIKSNQQAKEFPGRAAESVKDALAYSEWLTRNGAQVDLTTDGKTVSRVSVSGKLIIDSGVLVQ